MEDWKHWVHLIGAWTGIFANLFLLYIVLTEKTAKTYGIFLKYICLFNIYYAAIHLILEPAMLSDIAGFTLFSKTIQPYSDLGGFLGGAYYGATFCQSVCLLAIHTVYRYTSITGRWHWLFNSKKGILSIVMMFFGVSILWACLCILTMQPTMERWRLSVDDARDLYQVNLTPTCYIGPTFFDSNGMRWISLLGVVNGTITTCLTYVVMCYASFRLHRIIKCAIITEHARRVHMQLFKILITQLVAPIFLEYTTFFICVYGGVFRLPRYVAPIGPLLTAIFPFCDAMILVTFVKAYRLRAIEIIFRKSMAKHKILSSSGENGTESQQNTQNRLPPIQKT